MSNLDYEKLSLTDITDSWTKNNFNIEKERQVKIRKITGYNGSLESVLEYKTHVEIEVDAFLSKIKDWIDLNTGRFFDEFPEVNKDKIKVYVKYTPSRQSYDYGYDYCTDDTIDLIFEYEELESDKEVITRLKNQVKAIRKVRKKKADEEQKKIQDKKEYKEYLKLKKKFEKQKQEKENGKCKNW